MARAVLLAVACAAFVVGAFAAPDVATVAELEYAQKFEELLATVRAEGGEKSFTATLGGENYDACVNPLILVPGLGGCVLDFEVDESFHIDHSICKTVYTPGEWSSGLNRLWPALSALDVIPPNYYRDCWLDAMQVHYNTTTRRFSSTQGIQVRGRDYGGLDGVTNLFEIFKKWGPKMSAVYEKLVARLDGSGYVAGKNLRGVPYDFRMIADDVALGQMFAQLKAEIEAAYEQTRACATGPKKANVMSHSLGGPYFLYFLNTYVDQQWKDTYIKSFIPVSSPWTGAGKALRALISGDSEGLPGYNIDFLPALRIMGGLVWMAPFSSAFGDKKWVKIGDKTYTASPDDLQALFSSIAPERADVVDILRNHIFSRYDTVKGPNVPVYCLYGHGIVTEDFYVYEAPDKTNKEPIYYRETPDGNATASGVPPDNCKYPVTGDMKTDPKQGDGTAPLFSLTRCGDWDGKNGGHPVVLKNFIGHEHLEILSMDPFLDYAVDLLKQLQG